MSGILCSRCAAPLPLECPGCGKAALAVTRRKGGVAGTCRECKRIYQHSCPPSFRHPRKGWEKP